MSACPRANILGAPRTQARLRTWFEEAVKPGSLGLRDVDKTADVESVGIIVGAVVAVSGWLASGMLARRETRRQTRIEYLLSAYRRLDAASLRIMTTDHKLAIESAVSDIQLLGTPKQVALADAFADEFATDGLADTTALLEDLRASFRAELLLGHVPPRRTWLRIDREGQ